MMYYSILLLSIIGCVFFHNIQKDIPNWWFGICTICSFIPLLVEIRWTNQKSTSQTQISNTSKESSDLTYTPQLTSSNRIQRRRSSLMPLIAYLCIVMIPGCVRGEVIQTKQPRFNVGTGTLFTDTNVGFPPCSNDRCSTDLSTCIDQGSWRIYDDIYNYKIDPKPVLNSDGTMTKECRWYRTTVASTVPKFTFKSAPGIIVHFFTRSLWSLIQIKTTSPVTVATNVARNGIAAATREAVTTVATQIPQGLGIPTDMITWIAVAWATWSEQSEAQQRVLEEMKIRTLLDIYGFEQLPKHPDLLYLEILESQKPKK